MTGAHLPSAAALDAVASFFEYPAEGFDVRARTALGVLEREAPGLALVCRPLADAGSGLEETFARTFDWSGERSLDLGWHLYGEQYERGAFLVSMRSRLRVAGVEEATELPDHLTGVLRALGRMEAAEADAFCAAILAPALGKLVAGFDRTEPNPYRAPLVALDGLAREAAERAPAAPRTAVIPPTGGVS
jgi:nitrate reductase assembly molybdenum cofactor insertion protein NarJ